MENYKPKGFMKGKFITSVIYRAMKPSSAAHYVTKTNSKRNHPPSNSSPASVGFLVNHAADCVIPQQKQKLIVSPSTATASVSFVVNQEQVFPPQPKQIVSLVVSEAERETFYGYGRFDNPYGVVVDESVDMKADSYISSVQERFRLERVNSERKMSQDMLQQ